LYYNARVKNIQLASAILALLALSSGAAADELYLKSGGVLRGHVKQFEDDVYTIELEGGQLQDIGASSVSIADIAPDNPAMKSRVILFSEAPKKDRPKRKKSDKKDSSDGSETIAPKPDPSADFKKSGNVLKYAQDTVALANARTEQSQKNIEEMKAIAEAANT
jgi:hypothetical protein